jgi:hypothetical protein
MLALFTAFVVKHYFADGILQHGVPFKHQNKGKFGHIGGIWHSLDHAVLTGIILAFVVSPILATQLALLDFVCHYLIDWSKVNLCKKFDLCEVKKGTLRIKNDWYFFALMTDQLLHYLTYIWILCYV